MQMAALTKKDLVLIPRLAVATAFWVRFMGLMGKKAIGTDEGIFFPHCNSVHTFFMRFPIDVIYLSQSGEVLRVYESVSPWRLLLPAKRVKHVLEIQANRAKALGIQLGDCLAWGGNLS